MADSLGSNDGFCHNAIVGEDQRIRKYTAKVLRDSWLSLSNLPKLHKSSENMLGNRFGIMKFIGKQSVFMDFFRAPDLNKSL